MMLYKKVGKVSAMIKELFASRLVLERLFGAGKLHHYFLLGGYIFLCFPYFLWLHTFLSAYFSGSKTVTIGINWNGEANLELFLLMLSVPLVIFVLFDVRSRLRKSKVEIEEAA